MEIKRIILSTGRSPSFPGRVGYYASMSSKGGAATFYEIEFFLMRIGSLPENIRSLLEEEDTPLSEYLNVNSRSSPAHDITQTVGQMMKNLEYLDNYCILNLDVFIFVYSPGERPSSSNAHQYYLQRNIFCHSRLGHCMRAAIANAINILGGNEDASRILHKGPLHVQSLARAVDWITRRYGRYQGVKIIQSDPLAWLLRQTNGIFLVRLIGRGPRRTSNDHVICIDCVKGEIMDCVETNVMKFTAESIKCYVGDGYHLHMVEEVRKLIRQPTRTTGKKQRPPKSTEHKRRQRQRKRERKQQTSCAN